MKAHDSFIKFSEQDEVRGARRTTAEIVCGIQQECEHRATKQLACVDNFARAS